MVKFCLYIILVSVSAILRSECAPVKREVVVDGRGFYLGGGANNNIREASQMFDLGGPIANPWINAYTQPLHRSGVLPLPAPIVSGHGGQNTHQQNVQGGASFGGQQGYQSGASYGGQQGYQGGCSNGGQQGNHGGCSNVGKYGYQQSYQAPTQQTYQTGSQQVGYAHQGNQGYQQTYQATSYQPSFSSGCSTSQQYQTGSSHNGCNKAQSYSSQRSY